MAMHELLLPAFVAACCNGVGSAASGAISDPHPTFDFTDKQVVNVAFWTDGSFDKGYLFWEQYVNHHYGSIGGLWSGHKAVMVKTLRITILANDPSLKLSPNNLPNTTWALEALETMVAVGAKIAIFGCPHYVAGVVSPMLEELSINHFIPVGSSASFFSGAARDFMWGIMVDNSRYALNLISLASRKGAKSACLITFRGGSFFPVILMRGIRQRLAEKGIAVLLDKDHDKSVPQNATHEMAAFAHEVVKVKCDILLAGEEDYGNFGWQLQHALALARAPLMGVMITSAPFAPSWTSNLGSLGNWVFAPTQWHFTEVHDCPVFGTSTDFVASYEDWYENRTHSRVKPVFQEAVVVAAGVACQIALNSSWFEAGVNESAPNFGSSLRKAIGDINMHTFFGNMRFNRYGQNIGRDPTTVQVINGTPTMVLPSLGALAEPVLPVPTFDSIFGCRTGTFNTGLSCALCPEQHYSDKANLAECILCAEGFFSSEGASTCQQCSAGRYRAANTFAGCLRCPAGEYQPRSGQSACDPCVQGFYAPPGNLSTAGTLKCIPCDKGTFASDVRNQKCVECTPGRFMNSTGASACIPCPVGSYAGQSRATECSTCIGGQTTQIRGADTEEECGCPVNHYNREGSCLPCPDEVICEGHQTIPRLREGYYVEPKDGVFLPDPDVGVWMCQPKERCIGQATSGANPCAIGSDSLNCGRCADDYYRSGNSCQKCKGGSVAILPLFLLGAFLACLALHVLWNRRAAHAEAVEGVLASISFGIMLSFVQTLGIFDVLQFSWPEELRGLFDFFSIFLFNIAALRVPCIMPEHFTTTYLSRLASPLVPPLMFLAWMLLSHIGHTITKGRLARFSFSSILNSIGMLVMALYISAVTSVVSVFECYKSPNTKSSLRGYSYIACSSSEHFAMYPFGILGVIFYMIGIMTVMTYAAYVAPKKYHDNNFRVAVKFLVFKFRTATWWSGVMLMLRSLLIAMVPVIEPTDGYVQFLLMMGILTASLCVHLLILPYMDRFANMLESFELFLLLCILALGSWFIVDRDLDGKDKNIAQTLAGLMVAGVICGFIAVFGVFVFATFQATYPGRAREMHCKEIERLMPLLRYTGRTIANASEATLLELLTSATYIDRDHTYNMVRFVMLEVSGLQARRLADQRLPRKGQTYELVTEAKLLESESQALEGLRRSLSKSLTAAAPEHDAQHPLQTNELKAGQEEKTKDKEYHQAPQIVLL